MERAAAMAEKISEIGVQREKASKAQKKQADQMLNRQKKLINSFKVGDKVLLPVSAVDLGAADAENLLCVILEKLRVYINF